MISARDLLLAIWLKCETDDKRVYDFLKSKEEITQDEANEILKNIDKDKFIVIIDDDYPEALRYHLAPPLVIKRRKAK